MLEPEFKTKLKDGTIVLIRTVNPCDKQCISDGLAQWSPRSRHMRFFSPINNLSEAQLTYLTDVDNVNHVVIAATETAVEDPAGIGLARYILLKKEPDIAEFAISVSDEYQGRGVGPILLDLLIERARSNSIRILRGYVLKSNKRMINVLERLDANPILDEDGSLRYDLHIYT